MLTVGVIQQTKKKKKTIAKSFCTSFDPLLKDDRKAFVYSVLGPHYLTSVFSLWFPDWKSSDRDYGRLLTINPL